MLHYSLNCLPILIIMTFIMTIFDVEYVGID